MSKTVKNKPHTEDSLLGKLETKFAPPAWAFFSHVKNSVGGGSRTADGIAIACWRSLGLEIHGFEIKCSRADWLRELKHPEKCDEVFRYCDRWWIVAANTEIVFSGELPPTMGLMVPGGAGLKCETKAPKLEPEPLTRWFVAEVLRRRFQTENHPPALSREYSKGFDAGREQQKNSFKWEKEKHQRLQKNVDDFQRESGIELSEWTHGAEIGKAVRLVLNGAATNLQRQLEHLLHSSERIVEQIKTELGKVGETQLGEKENERQIPG
jgi:hypothetical protein